MSFSIITWFIFTLTMVSTALAEETLKIGVGDWSPYLDKDLKHQGVAARIISTAFEAAGYKVNIVMFPWARAFEEAKEGLLDGTAVWLKKPERELDFYFSDEVVEEQHVFFHLNTEKFTWNNVADIQNKLLGGLFNFSYGPEIDKAIADGKLKIDRVTEDKINFRKLIAGRIALYPQEVNVGLSVLLKEFTPEEREKVTFNEKQFMKSPSYLLMSKKNPVNEKRILQFNQALKAMREKGIIAEYFVQLQRGEYNKP